MPSQATVTAKSGPAIQATAEVLLGVTAITFDYERKVIQIYKGNQEGGPAREFDMSGVTTITDTITGANHVIVIS